MIPCDNCPHKKTVENRFGQLFEVCKNQCGQFVANSGHPLSPCEKGDCVYCDGDGHPVDVDPDEVMFRDDVYPECEVDEDCLFEGGRCITYIAWLTFMHKHNGGIRMKLSKGDKCILSFSRPMYDRAHQKFFPDNDRLNPLRVKIVHVTYCGIHEGTPRHCLICGRTSKRYHVFLDSNFKEQYLSEHCYRHFSTAVWNDEADPDTIFEWYQQQYDEVRE